MAFPHRRDMVLPPLIRQHRSTDRFRMISFFIVDHKNQHWSMFLKDSNDINTVSLWCEEVIDMSNDHKQLYWICCMMFSFLKKTFESSRNPVFSKILDPLPKLSTNDVDVSWHGMSSTNVVSIPSKSLVKVVTDCGSSKNIIIFLFYHYFGFKVVCVW